VGATEERRVYPSEGETEEEERVEEERREDYPLFGTRHVLRRGGGF